MWYVSTRGQSPRSSFSDILLAGLAPDGGLWMPEAWPKLSSAEIGAFARMSYPAAAYEILRRFCGDAFGERELKADIDAAYAGFSSPEIAPLVELGPGLFMLELFHGPTLAFKDIAMQVLGRLFSRSLAKSGGRATVIVATSGDTGSAAIAALEGLPNIDLFVIYPHGRISEVQRRQMTTSPHANVHTIALEGSFDDGQAIVKGLFADAGFVAATHLTAVNSINFARIAAQAVYYFTSAARLGAPPLYIVPTGNFGDVFAGEAARRMGLPLARLIVATNANDILARALKDGVYAPGRVRPSLSPSMDIQVASNFERALFEASGRNAQWTRDAMLEFANNQKLQIPEHVLRVLRSLYGAERCDDDETLATMALVHRETGRQIDPHTAVAFAAAQRTSGEPKVILATAHPAKFPDAVARATGKKPTMPPQLSGLFTRNENVEIVPNKLPLVRAFIEARLAHHET